MALKSKKKSEIDPHVVRTRLVALLCGVAVAVCAVVATFLVLPAQSVHAQDQDYGYVYSGTKSSSVEFVTSTLSEDSLVVLGSSEFSTPSRLVPEVPSQVFGTANYGLRLCLVGEAFDQCLWHTMALGALTAQGDLPRQKVVLIVGPGQFVDGGLEPETFQTRFSYTLLSAFANNDRIPEEARQYVFGRLAELGIDQTTIDSCSGAMPQDVINAMVFRAIDDLKLRQGLSEVRASGIPLAQGPATDPDFDALMTHALEDAHRLSTNNDWGLEDGFYSGQLGPVLDQIEGYRAGETYTNTPEYDDLDCFLDVCDALGVEALVAIEPVCGPYYDRIGIPSETRATCYDHIRAICEEHGASLADFSDREYEKYFLYDIVHFGWTGWVELEQRMYDFAMEA